MFTAAGLSVDLFLNRDESEDFARKHYRYPLVQYQVAGRNAAITAIGDGAEALLLFLDNPPPHIRLDGKKYFFDIKSKSGKDFELEKLAKPRAYRIFKWLALNSENYAKWIAMDSLRQRAGLLDSCIYGHILSLAAGLGKPLEAEELTAYTRSIGKESWVRVNDRKKLAFDATFVCNLALPDLIGLGQSPAHGFGKTRTLKKDDD